MVPFTVTIENTSYFPASFYYKADAVNFQQNPPSNITANQGRGITATITEASGGLGKFDIIIIYIALNLWAILLLKKEP